MKLSLYEQLALDQERAREAARQAQRRGREFARMRHELAGLELDLAVLKLWRARELKDYRDQPRVPAGNPDGGQWTSEGGGVGINDPRVISDATPDNDWIPGAQYAQITGERRYSVDLEQERPRGGHAVRDHVEKTEADLVKELNTDWEAVEHRQAPDHGIQTSAGKLLDADAGERFRQPDASGKPAKGRCRRNWARTKSDPGEAFRLCDWIRSVSRPARFGVPHSKHIWRARRH